MEVIEVKQLDDIAINLRENMFSHARYNTFCQTIDDKSIHVLVKKSNKILAGATYSSHIDVMKVWSMEKFQIECPYIFLSRGFAVPHNHRFELFEYITYELLIIVSKNKLPVYITVRKEKRKIIDFIRKIGFKEITDFKSYHTVELLPINLVLLQFDINKIPQIDKKKEQLISYLQQEI